MSLPQSAYYYTLRTKARRVVAESLNRRIRNSNTHEVWSGLTLCSIDETALDYARKEWPKHYSAQTHNGFKHSWEKLFYSYSHRPAAFDLAIWQTIGDERILQCLALGKPSDGKTHLTLNWVERYFGPNCLVGSLLPVLACAEEYGRLLGCERILIKDPVDPEKYGRYGNCVHNLRNVSGALLAKELK